MLETEGNLHTNWDLTAPRMIGKKQLTGRSSEKQSKDTEKSEKAEDLQKYNFLKVFRFYGWRPQRDLNSRRSA